MYECEQSKPNKSRSVWICCHTESPFPNPFLVVSDLQLPLSGLQHLTLLKVETDEGRVCTFGPYKDPSILMLKLLATSRHERICGIYYNALKLRSGP